VQHLKLTWFSILLLTAFHSCKGQKSFGSNELLLKHTVPLPNVKGRIDHLDANLKEQVVYVAALGNNSLEVIDATQVKVLHSIKNLNEPQGVVYVPQTNEVMVANGGNGSCYFYNAQTFEEVAKIDLGSDADDVRYDSIAKKIYVGYGEGGIAVIDAVNHKTIADAKLSAHPEGFQLDAKQNRLFVNVPGAGKIVVLSLSNMKTVAEWKTEFDANFPMAIDEKHLVIFVGYRRPGKLVAINEMNGQTIAAADLVNDIDDLYYDGQSNKLYASGGGGAINIFLFDNNKFEQVANIATRSGARTSLLLSSLRLFILAERSNAGHPAQLDIFSVEK
jgi:hypothetical protein